MTYRLTIVGGEAECALLQSALQPFDHQLVESNATHRLVLCDHLPSDDQIEQWKRSLKSASGAQCLILLVDRPEHLSAHEARFFEERLESLIAFLAVEIAYEGRTAAIAAPLTNGVLWDDVAKTVDFIARCSASTGQVFFLPHPKTGNIAVA